MGLLRRRVCRRNVRKERCDAWRKTAAQLVLPPCGVQKMSVCLFSQLVEGSIHLLVAVPSPVSMCVAIVDFCCAMIFVVGIRDAMNNPVLRNIMNVFFAVSQASFLYFEAVEVVECLYRVKLDFLHGLTIFKMSSAIWSSSSRLSESSC